MTPEPQQGYFSLLRWRPDVARDEPRNIAVLLADAEGRFAGMRPVPVSAISEKLHEQGLVDALLVGLKSRVEDSHFTLDELHELHGSLSGALIATEPRPVAVRDVEETIKALYRAFLAVRTGRSRGQTKGVVLDRVVNDLRRSGWEVRRGAYIDDFIFDVVIDEAPVHAPNVVSVFSFATHRKDWITVEKDAGHFLFARNALRVDAAAVVQGPTESSSAAREPFERVHRWLEGAEVPVTDASNLIKGDSIAIAG